MPNNKVKTLKKIKGKDTAHPFSRKAYQMRRAVHREQRIETGVDKGKQDKQRKLDRILFFKRFIPESLLPVSMEEMHNIVQNYINRYADELAELRAQIRPNRAKPPRIEKLELVKAGDEAEYKTGFEVPDFTNAANVQLFNLWNGDYNGMTTIKMISIAKEAPVKNSDGQLK